MKPGLNQSTQLRQELKINPRLYQAMDLLYMPLLDLQQHLKQELLNNPFLDLVEAEEEEEEEQETETEQPEKTEPAEERKYFEPVTVASRDLGDHLRDQVSLLELSPRQMVLADEFIGNINEDGYLASTVEEIVAALNEVVTRAAENAGREGKVPVYTLEEGNSMLGVIQ